VAEERIVIELTDLEANGMTFRCRLLGESGEPVVLLHGFPETSHMWTGLMPRLAEAGYRCLAPDQRGYSPGARPDDVEAYSYRALASDAFALADVAGFDRFHLVGHDWGALVGWAMLGVDASRIASYVSLSIPHALGFARAVYEDPEEEPYRGILQALLSEGVFEGLIQQNDGAAVRAANTHSPAEQADEYISVLSQPGAMKAAASWYRASRAQKRSLEDADSPFGPVTTPTLLIWGKNDAYVRRMSVDLAKEYMRGPYRVLELDAGHWLAQEAPDDVSREVLAHLRANPIRG
jgi:pimeloyl-ACP methyl ester carboxylesterase